MREAFALNELIFDAQGKALSYRILDANAAYFSYLGLDKNNIIGKMFHDLFPYPENCWADELLGCFVQVIEKQEDMDFETYCPSLGKWFSIRAFPLENNQFATLFLDTSHCKGMEETITLDESRFKAVVNSLEDLVFTLDAAGNYTEIFGRWLERFGLRKESFIGKSILEGLSPESRRIHADALAKTLHGEISVHECDFLVIGTDKSPLVQVLFSPIFMQGKVVGIVGVGRDISEMRTSQNKLKQLLDEKTILLQEVQHRVKNNLQIIISLIQLQALVAQHADDASVFRLLQSRIYAIASVHDVLAASAVNDQVSLAALVRTLSTFCLSMPDTFPGLADIRVKVEEALCLPLETAIPIALVLHECFLSCAPRISSVERISSADRTPSVGADIELVVHGKAMDGDRCSLVVRSPYGKVGGKQDELGSLLMEGLIDQIRGTLEETLDQGYGWTLQFPIKGAGHPIYPLK
jgi:PAS domain S-box-containing protein